MGLEAGMLDFLLGRPVEQVVRLLERQADSSMTHRVDGANPPGGE
jgi:hypothetical protein